MANESATLSSPFHGMWEIIESSLGEQSKSPDLKGVKFRLDEMGDIIWYNDVVYCQQLASPMAAAAAMEQPTMTTSADGDTGSCSGQDVFNELASILLACESFDILTAATTEPALSFSTYSGHTIEFKTQSLSPGDTMTLNCEGLYRITCKRVKEGEAIGQAGSFSLISALQEGYFTDVIIKSSDGLYFEAHSVILRLNGFDCSMNFKSDLLASGAASTDSPSSLNALENNSHPSAATNHFLLPPPSSQGGCMAKKGGLTGSFNCLSSSPHLLSPPTSSLNHPHHHHHHHHANNNSSSDSDLRQSCQNRKEVFNFTTPLPMTPTETTMTLCGRWPPLSPRFRCGTPTMPPCLDTPPTSPLTPISILYNLPCSMLKPIIYWLYTESIPTQLTEEICQKLMVLSEQTPPLNKMTNPCRRYLKNLQLKKYIIDLSMDIHGYLNRIITLMTPRKMSHHPRHLCSVFVESLRELSVGCAKILDFCNIFVRDAKHLSRFQRHEIIKYTRSRVPIFLKQWHQILENIFAVLSSLTAVEKAELAVYLVPQIEKTLDQFRSIALDVKTSLERMYEHLKSNGTKGATSGKMGVQSDGGGVNGRPTSEHHHSTYRNKFGETENDLTFFLYMYEVRKTRDIYGRIKSVYETIDQNRYTFVEMSQLEKERTIRRNLDFLLLEFPSYIKRLESLENNFDSNVGWKEFKFCFKLGTGQINGVISKLVEHKRALQSTILRICDLVHRSDFVYTMTNLGMLEVPLDTSNDAFSADGEPLFSPPPPPPDMFSPRSPSNRGIDLPPVDYKSIKLNLVKHLCESPNILFSNLSKNALRLLHSGEMSDMEFEVISNLQLTPLNRSAFLANQLPKVHVFRAHRAIVCSRCEYFRRALLSGMKEDINRKIVVQDTSPVIFRRFLLYLYGAPIDRTVAADQICELMLLGDRYSLDELKDICEQILKAQIDEDSVIFLLSIADRFNANTLKSNCLSFISNRVHLINMDIFVELSPQLQDEVHELIQWRSRTPQPWHTTGKSGTTSANKNNRGVNGEGEGLILVPPTTTTAQGGERGTGGGGLGAEGERVGARSPNRTSTGAAATATSSPFM